MARLTLLLALTPSLAFAWGFDGHRRLSSMMQDPLPSSSCLRQWFAARQTAALQDSSCDPDRWRYMSAGAAYDPSEGPRHYLEIDWVSPISDYPRDWSAAVARLGGFATKNGVVPWRVEELYARLVEDFRARSAVRILDTAFILSHYVTDAFSVLHNTKNSDPNDGLHGRWESDMLDSTSNLNGVATLARSYFGTVGKADPRNNIFDVVLVGNGLVPALIAADIASTSTAQLYTATRDLTARRWGDALTVMASLLWSAWAEAGAPELPGFSGSCSRAVPTGEIAIIGYPPAGGFTHPKPDAGPGGGGGGRPPDAGAGGGGGGGEVMDGGALTDGGVAPPVEPLGCTCASAGSPLVFAFWAAVSAWARRRRRR
jgi:hypothetical protein